jgi:hypothetical protein
MTCRADRSRRDRETNPGRPGPSQHADRIKPTADSSQEVASLAADGLSMLMVTASGTAVVVS